MPQDATWRFYPVAESVPYADKGTAAFALSRRSVRRHSRHGYLYASPFTGETLVGVGGSILVSEPGVAWVRFFIPGKPDSLVRPISGTNQCDVHLSTGTEF